ncbi:MAG: hypothetical protein ACI9F9_002598, partial [Candidatus Paceibacteria bacterium]
KIGETWYRLENEKSGTSLTGYAVPMETGKINLNFKGKCGNPTWLIVKGMGKYENCYFDVMNKDTELPVGNYTLYCGEVRKGKKAQVMKTLILPPKDPDPWVVTAGGTTNVPLGAPFGFDFKFDEDGKNISVLGKTVVITGLAGERYERPWNCVPKPTASWRKKGEKRGSKAEKFKKVQSQDEINAGGWGTAWFPVDLEIVKKGASDGSEVQLAEKKNKLFGKIESAWRE